MPISFDAQQRLRIPMPLPLTATKTFDPGTINDTVILSTTITITGAELGDICQASFSLELKDIDLTAFVSVADTVKCVFHNDTGGNLTLASGTLRAVAIKY